MPRIPALDGWRGIAILMVLVSHAQVGMVHTFVGGHSWLIRGRDGVAIFFVLSGYLITSKLIAEPISLKEFYARRFFRIMPAAWFYVASAVLIGYLTETRPDNLNIESALGCFRNYLGYSQQGGNVRISHFWSLSTEEQFYILWPALVVILGRKILPFAILAFTALSMSVYWKGITYTSGLSLRPEMNAHMLLAGCLLALVFANYPSAERWMKRWSPVLVPLSVLGIAIHLVVQRIVAPPTEAICIAIAIGASGPSSLLDWKPLTYLGKVSYSIYLWQQMFLMSLFGWVCLPLSLGMGILSYIYIEQPCIRLGARIMRRKPEERVLFNAVGPTPNSALQGLPLSDCGQSDSLDQALVSGVEPQPYIENSPSY